MGAPGSKEQEVSPETQDDPWGDGFFWPACVIAALQCAMFLLAWYLAHEPK